MGLVSPIYIVMLFIALASLCLVLISHLQLDLLGKNPFSRLTIYSRFKKITSQVAEQQATYASKNVLVQLDQLKSIQFGSGYNQRSLAMVYWQKAHDKFKHSEFKPLLRQVFHNLSNTILEFLVKAPYNIHTYTTQPTPLMQHQGRKLLLERCLQMLKLFFFNLLTINQNTMKYQETLYRLNTLLEYLQQNKEACIHQLLTSLQVPRSTLIRDIERLQNLGHEIEYCRKRRAYILVK